MLTIPTKYADVLTDEAAREYWIYVITFGTTTLVFSTIDMNITIGTQEVDVLGYVLSDPNFGQGVNLFQRTGEISGLTLELSNSEYQGKPIAEHLYDSEDATVELYILAGEKATNITDALKVFKGTISESVAYTKSKVTVSIESFSRLGYPFIPEINPDSGGAGRFLTPYVQGLVGTEIPYGYSLAGRIKATPLTSWSWSSHQYIAGFGDDISINSVWVFIKEINRVVEVDPVSYSISTDYLGNTIITLDPFFTCYIYIRPNRIVDDPYAGYEWDPLGLGLLFNTNRNQLDDLQNLSDMKKETYSSLRVCSVAQPTFGNYWSKAMFMVGFPDLIDADRELDFIDIDDTNIKFMFRCSPGDQSDGLEYTPNGATNVSYWADGEAGGRYEALDLFESIDRTLNISAGNWKTGIGLGLQRHNVRIAFCTVSEHGGINPINFNYETLKARECYFRIKGDLNFKQLPYPRELYWSGAGNRVDTPIAFRPAMPSSAIVNEYPSIAIEKLLREKMGFTDANIDTDSFDDFYDPTNYRTRITLDEEEVMRADKLFQEISENSNFTFYHDFSDKARLVPINPTDPSSPDVIFTAEDLSGLPEVSRTSREYVSNRITFNHEYNRQQQEVGSRGFEKTWIFEDAASIAKYGEREATGSFRFALDADILDGSQALPRDIMNLLANTHSVVKVPLKLRRGAHYQPGDWLGLDPTSIDPLIKYENGASWSGLKFMIIDKQFTKNGVTLTGYKFVKVYP